jgi:hypothetical protein
MQKIKNVSVGCIVLVSIVGHSAVQGMERKINPVLLQAAEEMWSYETNVDFINKQMLREKISKSINQERDASGKFIPTEKLKIEPKTPFFCDKCTFVSIYSHSLRRHIKNMHPKK